MSSLNAPADRRSIPAPCRAASIPADLSVHFESLGERAERATATSFLQTLGVGSRLGPMHLVSMWVAVVVGLGDGDLYCGWAFSGLVRPAFRMARARPAVPR